jgi:ribosomal protein L37AE/L43A
MGKYASHEDFGANAPQEVEIVELDKHNPQRKKAAKERAEQKTKFDYCSTCRRYSWMRLNNRQWVCNECGCPTGGEACPDRQ